MEKNWKSRLTSVENWKREGMNTAYVAIGLVGATLIDRLVQKAADKWLPASITPYVSYLKVGTQMLGGFGLSLLSDEKTPEGDRLRLIGYGISGAGLISGLRLIPAVDKLMSDPVSGLNGVEKLLGLSLGEFGNVDNIKQISTSDAEQINLDLPDLGRANPQPLVYDTQETERSDEEGETIEVFAEVI